MSMSTHLNGAEATDNIVADDGNANCPHVNLFCCSELVSNNINTLKGCNLKAALAAGPTLHSHAGPLQHLAGGGGRLSLDDDDSVMTQREMVEGFGARGCDDEVMACRAQRSSILLADAPLGGEQQHSPGGLSARLEDLLPRISARDAPMPSSSRAQRHHKRRVFSPHVSLR
jgi:hypothetical protein